MKKLILLVATAAGAALFGLSDTAQARNGFSVQLYGGSGYYPGGYYYASPSYYYTPRYYSSYYRYPYYSYYSYPYYGYSYPSYGYSYYRPYYRYSYSPGFSLRIGRGWGGRSWGYRPRSRRYYRW